jgi:tripeptide aminopeptidase
MESILQRFLRYAKINTRSDEEVTDRTPSTENQWELARLLEKELTELGLKNVHLNEKCFLTAELPPTSPKKLPVIAFLAHMDTSPDFNAESIQPQVIDNYDGGDIQLKGKPGMALRTAEFADLLNYKGCTLVTTDGTTLLGADDKAGVAAIMDALAWMGSHPEFKHGPVKVAFTPDEETSYGITHFDVNAFGADLAYTIDGGKMGELEFENFNAGRAFVTIHGKSVHPGDAKGVMVNAMLVFFEFNGLLPVEQRPEFTAGREGFYHLWKMSEGSVEQVQGVYLLRDHDAAKYDRQKQVIQACADFINTKYGAGTVEVRIEEQYRNMREQLEPVMHVVDTARQAMRELNITPIENPIRGGTDGARLSYRGLPTPNLFNGGHNFHGPYEYLVVEHMQMASAVIRKILELYESKQA